MTKLNMQPSEIDRLDEDNYIRYFNTLNFFLKKEDEAYKKSRRK